MTRRYLRIVLLVILTVSVCIAVYFLFARWAGFKSIVHRITGIIMPFLVGGAIAFIIKPLCNLFDLYIGRLFVNKIRRRAIEEGRTTEVKVRKLISMISILLSMLIFFTIIAGLLFLAIPALVSGIRQTINNLPSYITSITAWRDQVIAENATLAPYVQKISDVLTDFINNINADTIYNQFMDRFPDIIDYGWKFVTGTLSFLVDCLVSFVSIFYLLYNRKKFAAQLKLITYGIFIEKHADWLVAEVKFANKKFSEFLSGKALDSLLVGLILFIIMSIVGLPQAPLIAVFMGVCNMIPFFGPYIGAFPSLFFILLADPTQPINLLYFLIIVIIVQQLDGNVLDPLIVGDNIGLSSFWVLFAVLLFGDLFGFVGLVIGVPLFAVIYDIIRQVILYRLRRKGKADLIDEYTYAFHTGEESEHERKKNPIFRFLHKIHQSNVEQVAHEAEITLPIHEPESTDESAEGASVIPSENTENESQISLFDTDGPPSE